jgi:uncharacterized protein
VRGHGIANRTSRTWLKPGANYAIDNAAFRRAELFAPPMLCRYKSAFCCSVNTSQLAASHLSGYSMPWMPESFLIVDGHSMIFAWPELLALQRRNGAAAREDLIKTLTAYQDLSGIHVVVVFDGKGEQVNEITEPGGIQIFYSNAGRTADEIVERLVAKYAHKHTITVATADLLEQQTVISFGAQCVGSEGLRRRIEEAKAEFAAELKRRRRADNR